MKNPVVRYGLAFGIFFALVGIIFVLISIFTDINRPLWVVLNQVKGVICFGLCGLGGVLVVRRTERVKTATLTGLLTGTIGSLVVTAALYVVPYGFIDHVRQYPFEHYSYINSGAANIKEYLLSERGRATVTSTSIGLIPIVIPIAALLGAAVATFGGWIGKMKWRNKAMQVGLAAVVAMAALSICFDSNYSIMIGGSSHQGLKN